MKRKMALLFAILLIIANIPIYAFAADNPDADDNTRVVLQYSLTFTGSGTQDDPFYGELNYRSGKLKKQPLKL